MWGKKADASEERGEEAGLFVMMSVTIYLLLLSLLSKTSMHGERSRDGGC